MRRRVPFPIPALVAGMVASLLLATSALAAPMTFTADLSGTADGDPEGSGSATVTLDPDTGEVCWELSVEGIGDAVASHIHVGAEGESGGIVVPLDVDGFSGTSDECATPADADLASVVADPAGHYVNIHTEEFPGGAIRGQLTAAGGTPDTALGGSGGTGFGGPLMALGLLLVLGGLAGAVRLARRSA